MRIIRNECRGGAGFYVVKGWANAVRAMGWEYKNWDGKDAERIFDEFEPDIYIGDVRFRHKIPRQIKTGRTKVVVTVDQWVKPWAFPILAKQGYRTKWHDVWWIRRLDPVFVFHHTSPQGIERAWDLWKKREGFNIHSFLLAGDTIRHFDEGVDPAFECDIAYVGGYWQYKSIGLQHYLLDYGHKYKMIIYGAGWPNGMSWGEEISDSLINKLFKTAKFIPCVHEPHAREYGYETTERLYKISLAGGFTVSDPVRCIYSEDIFSEDEIIVARSPEDMADIAEYFIKNPEERLPYIERARKRILNEHTYFHRLGKLLKLLGYEKELAMLKSKMQTLGLGVKTFR